MSEPNCEIAFPDFVDQDPYEGWPECLFDSIDKVWTPTVPEFVPTAYDVIYLGDDMFEAEKDSPIVLYFAKGQDRLKVMMDRSFRGSNLLPSAEDELEVQNALEICQTFIHGVDFASTNTVMAHKDAKTGAWRHVARKGVPIDMLKKECWPWHVIDRGEVRITRWVGMGGWQDGMWGDVPVDVRFFDWEDLMYVTHDIIGTYLMGELPYVYKYQAAMLTDNVITGLVSEPREGRPLRVFDRPKVLRALDDIEAIGLVYMDVLETHICIGFHDDNVKFTYPHRLFWLEHLGPVERAALIDRRHRQGAANLFARLAARERQGVTGNLMLSRYHGDCGTVRFPRRPQPHSFVHLELEWPDHWAGYAEVLAHLRDWVLHDDEQSKRQKRERRTARRIMHPEAAPAPAPETTAGRVARRSTARSDARRQQAAGTQFVHYAGPPPKQAKPPPQPARQPTAHSATVSVVTASHPPAPRSAYAPSSHSSGGGSWAHVSATASTSAPRSAHPPPSSASSGGSWAHVSRPHSSAGSAGSYEIVERPDDYPHQHESTGTGLGSLLSGLLSRDRVAALSHIGTSRRGHHDYAWSGTDAARFEEVEDGDGGR